ncbi:beta-ketoacyl-[acyl-carrier-protein] synthase family protein [Streptomyces sp. NPDC127098]|uniref:beta-ketoacyl-[acyl-carrier-protein] synthase family protein n=1 Tax=Streptomyces sp. NPDC127098 TaxID=3347137 RepID=UPI00365600E2
MSRDEVVVSGVGAITPAGVGVAATWEGVCRGLGTATRDPALAGLPVDFSCRVPGEDIGAGLGVRNLWRMERFTRLALVAAVEAVGDAGLDPATWDGARVGVVVGCGMGGMHAMREQERRLTEQGPDWVSPALIPMMLPNMAAGEIALALGARGPSLAAVTACASGASAVATAREWLVAGRCDVVVAGGAESATTPLMVTGFQRAGTLSRRGEDPAGASRPFAADSDGFVMAEGAAVLVLERMRDLRARGGRARAVLAGCGVSTDAHHPTAPHPEGRGAEAAVRAALAQAGAEARDVEHVNAHATSTRQGDTAEGRMIERVFPHGPSVTSAKGALGHGLGAAGAVEAVLTVLSVERGVVPPTANVGAPAPDLAIDLVVKKPRERPVPVAVSDSFGFGGHNVALVFVTG